MMIVLWKSHPKIMAIAIVTVCYQAIKAAMVNLVKSLWKG